MQIRYSSSKGEPSDKKKNQTRLPIMFHSVCTWLAALIALLFFCNVCIAQPQGGIILAFGDNTYGQTNVPTTLTNVVAISANWYQSSAIKSDGSILGWGSLGATIPEGISNVIAVAEGLYHGLALLTNGTVVAWGDDYYGQIDVPVGLSNVTAIAAGKYNSLALQQDGTIVGWGDSQYCESCVPSGLGKVKAIACGSGYSLALKSDGTIFGWGNNPFGQTSIPQNATNVVSISAGDQHSLALRSDGAVVAWGNNDNGEINVPSNLSNVVAIAAGWNISVALKSDGTVVGWGNNYSGELSFPVWMTNIVSVAAGAFNTLVLMEGEPVIIQQPTNVTVYSGHNVDLNVTAIGPLPIFYQWQHNVTNIDSPNTASLTISNVQPADTGNYGVLLANAYGMSSSALASLTVVTSAPVILSYPSNQTVAAGSNVVLAFQIVGSYPISYQWQLNGNSINDATNSTLVLTNVQITSQGNLTIMASNSFGVVASSFVSLTVMDIAASLNATNLVWSSSGNQPWFPEFSITHDVIAALQSGPIGANQQSTVSTMVSGPGTLSFWWRISSETNNDYLNLTLDGAELARNSGLLNQWQQRSFYLPNGTHSLAWNYTKNATINRGSDAAWLDQVSYVPGGTAAFVMSGPANQIATISANATLTVTVSGTPPIGYQWFFNGSLIPANTNASLTITNVQAANTGIYAVAVTNDYGGAISTNANLYLLSVYAWGAGQSNTFTTPNYGQCIVPTNLLGVTAIAAGGYHSLALRSNGTVVAWGYNSYNQTNVPLALTNATAVAAGLFHSMVLQSDRTVVVWGNSSYSQTTVPASASNVTAIATGWYHCLALRSNGTVVAWGAGTSQGFPPNYGQSIVPVYLGSVTAIAAGGYHSLALRTNGTVVAWGWNASGQTNVPLGLNNVIAIAAGVSNSVALKSDGTLVAWGANGNAQTNIPNGLTNVVAISCGAAHNMALRNDGALVVWGLNGNGQTNIPSGLTNIAAISAGAFHSMAVINIGPITSLGQPMRQTNYTASTVALTSRAFGALPLSYQWEFNGTNIDGATNALLILTNLPFSAAGNYWCITSNSFGAVTNLVATLTVLRSTPWFNPVGVKLSGDGFGLELDRLSGHGIIVIYASSNLVDWIPILTNPPQVGTLELVDPKATNMPARFYRAEEY